MTLRRWLPLIVIALGAALGFVLLRDRVGFDVLRDNQLALLAYRADHPVLMPVLFVGAYALFVAFSLPGAIWFTLAGGFLFGVIPGVLYNVGAATIGALALFLAVRTGLGEGLRARIDASDGAVRRLTDGLRANEVPVLLSMRLIPVVPFFIANLIPAFLGVGAARFAWTTALGIVPGGWSIPGSAPGRARCSRGARPPTWVSSSSPSCWGRSWGWRRCRCCPSI